VTIGLVVAIFIFSKREDYKGIAKLSLAPGIFNINETMTFGLPIMLNPIIAIPFIITPLITGAIGYFLTVVGFADVLVYAVPWTTPPILSAWLASGGSITCIITQLICIVVSIAIYIPFVMAANKQKTLVEE
ncbi:MAG: PTS transporter subunit EIIC, partial [Coprobacillus sp.]